MRNMLMVDAASVALMGATQAMAQSVDSLQLGGEVEPICEVRNLDAALDFRLMETGQVVEDLDLEIQCNDVDGAELTLQSAEGGMEADDAGASLAIPYSAVFDAALAGLPLTPNAPGGILTNGIDASASIPGSLTLADGVPATLVVTLQGDAVWAGGYSDTLEVFITPEI